jgi:hypothetical protein
MAIDIPIDGAAPPMGMGGPMAVAPISGAGNPGLGINELIMAMLAGRGGPQMGSPMGGAPLAGANTPGMPPTGLPFPRPGVVGANPMGGQPDIQSLLGALGGPNAGMGQANPMGAVGMGRLPVQPRSPTMSPVGGLIRQHFAGRPPSTAGGRTPVLPMAPVGGPRIGGY